jgi:hypothetical protein
MWIPRSQVSECFVDLLAPQVSFLSSVSSQQVSNGCVVGVTGSGEGVLVIFLWCPCGDKEERIGSSANFPLNWTHTICHAVAK